MSKQPPWPSPLEFFARLKWIDGRNLLDTIEDYRRRLFMSALFEFGNDGVTPRYNFILAGRAAKNSKSTDLVLAALHCLLVRESAQGNDCFLVANDLEQAALDLDLATKLVTVNKAEIGAELQILSTEIRRSDGAGSLEILPARNVVGQHGRTALFVGYDEIHGYRNYDLFEALKPDPTRADALQWVTSYDTIYNSPGTPLHDLKKIGREGSDPRLLFSWYSGDYCTDPSLAALSPEQRANPSMASWPDGAAYIEQQRRRLPAHKFRRLHLNLPGAPSGAFFDPDKVTAAIVTGRRTLPPQEGKRYFSFVDMSGGSSDDATLSIAHKAEDGKSVVDLIDKQAGDTPFNPRQAIAKFAGLLKHYGVRRVTGDNYAGQTFKLDFEAHGIAYQSCGVPKTKLYEELEPPLNAGEVEFPDHPTFQEQMLGLVTRGMRVDHLPGDRDDHVNAVAGAVWCVRDADSAPVAQFGRYTWR